MAGCELEIPERDDDAVVEAIKFLNGKLRTDLMKDYLKEAGEYLYVATNATAKDADQQIKVQSCLFDAVKLCDAWNLMLTSFKVGASDILEKLHIAFLKLLDGFPDYALADVQSVTKHVSSMKAACEKARGSFTKCRQELKEVIAFLGKEKKKLEENCNESSTVYSKKIERLGSVCSVDKAFEREDSFLRLAYLEREEPRDKYQAVKKTIPNCVLAEKELELALPKLDEAVDFLGKVERLVNDWYNECKEVVEKNMKLNVKHAEKMSEAKQKEFWKTLPFAQTAYQFLCRWKALQQICLSTSSHMRRVRGDIDWYYTENLYPSEAVQKAWELMKNHKDLPKTLRPYPDMVVPEAGRNKALCFLPELMVLSSTPKDIFKLREYRKNIENIRKYLGILESTGVHLVGANNPVQKMRQDLGTLLSLLYSAAFKLSAYSFDAILKMHLTSLCILDGMSGAAEQELNTIWDDRKDFVQVIGQIAEYRAEINTGSFVALQNILDDQVLQLETRLKKEVDDELRAANPGNTEQSYFDKGCKLVKSLRASSSDSLNSNNTAEQIKLSKFAKELLQLISKELPIMETESVYKEIWDDLKDQAVLGREELRVVVEALQGETLGQEMRGQVWQEGIVRLMMGLKDLHIASRAQASSLKDVSDRIEGKITRLNWRGCMAMVSNVDCTADSQARRINREVDGDVQNVRAEAKAARERELEEERKKQLEERRRREAAAEKKRLEEEEERKKRAAREKELEEERQKQLEEERKRREAAAEKKRLEEEEEGKKAVEEEKKRLRQERLKKERNAKKEGSADQLPGHVVRNNNGTSSGTRKLLPNARKRNVLGGSTKPNQRSGSSQSEVDTETGMKSGSDEDETSFTMLNEAQPGEVMGAHVPEAEGDNTEKFDKLCEWPENQEKAEGAKQPSSVDEAGLAEGAHQDGQKGDASVGAEDRKLEGQRAADDSSKAATQINEPGFGRRTPQTY